MGLDLYALVAVAAVAAAIVTIGGYGARISRTTSDPLVASRTVGQRWNAAAISGEYLSAASFLGVAGLVLKEGADALWYPIGFTAGYLVLMLFVAAPLRRSGAYTLPDFAEARLGSVGLRKLATGLVVIIGWLYLVPQMQAAGLVLSTFAGWPGVVGTVLITVIVVANVVVGGMRSITFVQAFQYWLKLAALAIPVFVLLLWMASERTQTSGALSQPTPPAFTRNTTVTVHTDVVLQADSPMLLVAHGRVDGALADGPVYWGAGRHEVRTGTTLNFTAGSAVPVVAGAPVHNNQWLRPLMRDGPDDRPLYEIYSLILALFLGTMGLPHVLVRFYTNPDGRAARCTTMWVLSLLSTFYLLPIVCGTLARLYVPQLLVTGGTDAAVLLLPGSVLESWPGRITGALVAAGAFAAFMSSSSGLVMSVGGVLATDVLAGRLRDRRLAALLAALVPLVFALNTQSLDVARGVALAFAVAASTFCPLLVLGIWWRGLTDAGAIAGLVLGGGLALVAALGTSLGVAPPSGLLAAIMVQPAAITVPLTFVTMVVVSKATAERVPGHVARFLARLHAPERLGLAIVQAGGRAAQASVPSVATGRAGRHRR